jgi:type VI secretion system secreted protein VgrG
VRRYEAEGTSGGGGERHRFRAWLAPRLWLLSRKRSSRIFQEKTVPEIVDQVLSEWNIARRWNVLSAYKPRTYCVQYQETDLGFIQRLLAEEGIFYGFEHPDEEKAPEIVVFSDNAHLWPPIAGSPLLELRDSGGMDEREEDVRRFRLQERARPGSVYLKEFDFARPAIDLHASARVPIREGAFDAALGNVYDHHGEFERGVDVAEAERHLDQHRARAKVGVGESRCRRLVVGRWFELRGCPIWEHDGRYTVLRVEHEGRQPEISALAEENKDVYKNSFACVPMGLPFRPRRPRRRIRQVMETATVVGPPGHDIHTDEHGRIKVQFHWDLEGKRNERSSCWIRAMQPWAGAGWGFQFIPRVGMEVLVTFVGGDVDRPMVVGSAYNGANVPPFQLPMSKTRSGVRTQTSPGTGYNELSFEDYGGREQIAIHAQKDFDTTILNNQTTRVGASRKEEIGEHCSEQIGRNSMTRIGGDCSRAVGGNEASEIQGSRSSIVRGNLTDLLDGRADVRVGGDRNTRIEGDERHSVEGSVHLTLDDEVTVRVGGSVATVIGRHDARRSYVLHVEGVSQLSSSRTTQISSESELVLACGKSSIRLTPDRIELLAPTITLEASGGGASFGDGQAQISGKQSAVVSSAGVSQLKSAAAGVIVDAEVKVAGPLVPVDPAGPALEPPKQGKKPTSIVLADRDGNALPHQRFRITQEDGSVLGGMTDKDGKAVVDLSESASIVFPDLGKVDKT